MDKEDLEIFGRCPICQSSNHFIHEEDTKDVTFWITLLSLSLISAIFYFIFFIYPITRL